MPPHVFLNVNVPDLPAGELRGIQTTRQGLRVYRDRLDRRIDRRGGPYCWIGGDVPTGVPEPGTDVGAIHEGYVSVTPLQLHLTAHIALDEPSAYSWEFPAAEPAIGGLGGVALPPLKGVL